MRPFYNRPSISSDKMKMFLKIGENLLLLEYNTVYAVCALKANAYIPRIHYIHTKISFIIKNKSETVFSFHKHKVSQL